MQKMLLLPAPRTLQDYRGPGYSGGMDAEFLQGVVAEFKESEKGPADRKCCIVMDSMNIQAG